MTETHQTSYVKGLTCIQKGSIFNSQLLFHFVPGLKVKGIVLPIARCPIQHRPPTSTDFPSGEQNRHLPNYFLKGGFTPSPNVLPLFVCDLELNGKPGRCQCSIPSSSSFFKKNLIWSYYICCFLTIWIITQFKPEISTVLHLTLNILISMLKQNTTQLTVSYAELPYCQCQNLCLFSVRIFPLPAIHSEMPTVIKIWHSVQSLPDFFKPLF